jgi:hypothetical protein
MLPIAQPALAPSSALFLDIEPTFDLLVDPDADIRANALRALVSRRDPSTFVLLCAGEAVDAAIRERDGLPPSPLSWRGWRGIVMGPVLAMPADQRLVWALEFAGKLLEPQRYPTSLLRLLGRSPSRASRLLD